MSKKIVKLKGICTALLSQFFSPREIQKFFAKTLLDTWYVGNVVMNFLAFFRAMDLSP